MQDKDYKNKTEKIKELLSAITTTTDTCAINYDGCYFDYDSVIEQLKNRLLKK